MDKAHYYNYLMSGYMENSYHSTCYIISTTKACIKFKKTTTTTTMTLFKVVSIIANAEVLVVVLQENIIISNRTPRGRLSLGWGVMSALGLCLLNSYSFFGSSSVTVHSGKISKPVP